MLPEEQYTYIYHLIFLVGLCLGGVATIRFLVRKQYADGLLCLALYVIPAVFIDVAVPILAEALAAKLSLEPDAGRFLVLLPFAPFLFLWIIWLMFGGFMLADSDWRPTEMLQGHFTPRSIRQKAKGALLMFVAPAAAFTLLRLLVPASRVLPGFVSILLFLGVAVGAFLLYCKGALEVVFPAKHSDAENRSLSSDEQKPTNG